MPDQTVTPEQRMNALARVITTAIDNLYADPHREPYVRLTETTAQTIREALMEAAEALSRLKAQEAWQDISSAPKMRTILLFAVTDVAEDGTVRNWKMATGSWHEGYNNDRSRAENYTPWSWDGYQLKSYQVQPTHWRPLPPAPADSRE